MSEFVLAKGCQRKDFLFFTQIFYSMNNYGQLRILTYLGHFSFIKSVELKDDALLNLKSNNCYFRG